MILKIDPETHYSNPFVCMGCRHETVIYIEKEYSLFNQTDVNKDCSVCGYESEDLSDGDLIFRKDWQDPDFPPYQVQSAYMKDEDRYCYDCSRDIEEDWSKLYVECPKCGGDMQFFVPLPGTLNGPIS